MKKLKYIYKHQLGTIREESLQLPKEPATPILPWLEQEPGSIINLGHYREHCGHSVTISYSYGKSTYNLSCILYHKPCEPSATKVKNIIRALITTIRINTRSFENPYKEVQDLSNRIQNYTCKASSEKEETPLAIQNKNRKQSQSFGGRRDR